MKRSSVLLFSTVLAALVIAAPALATPAPPPTAYTSPSLMPSSLSQAATYVYGSPYVQQVPAGSTALVWNLTLVAGQTTDLTMQCPAGTAVADLNITGPTTGFGETTPLPIFTPWYGQNAPSVSFGTQTPGQLIWAVLCVPSATAKTTTVHGRSPVTFAKTMGAPAVRKGAKLPSGAVVLKSVTTSPVNPNGTLVTMSPACPGGTYGSNDVVTQPGHGGASMNNGFLLYPSTSLTGTVTVYVLCAP